MDCLQGFTSIVAYSLNDFSICALRSFTLAVIHPRIELSIGTPFFFLQFLLRERKGLVLAFDCLLTPQRMYRPSFEATRVHVSPRDYQSVVALDHSLNDLCAGVRKNYCTSVIHSLILSKNQVTFFPLVYTSGRMGKDSRSTVLLNLYCSVSFLEFLEWLGTFCRKTL